MRLLEYVENSWDEKTQEIPPDVLDKLQDECDGVVWEEIDDE